MLPESKLRAVTFSGADDKPASVGQIWMVKLVPLVEGQPVPASKLRVVHLSHGDKEVDAPLCALGVRKGSDGGLELLIYGKSSEPVMRVPLKTITAEQDTPIVLAAERREEGGLITLKFLGKYEASFMVTDPDKY